MSKTYTLEDGESLMAELKSTRGMMAEMRGRLERDEITPDEWRAKPVLTKSRRLFPGCVRRFLAEMQIWNVRNARGLQN